MMRMLRKIFKFFKKHFGKFFSNQKVKNIGKFFKEHRKVIVVVVIIIVIAILLLVNPCAGGNSKPVADASNGITVNKGGITGIVSIDSTSVGVFDTKDEAAANPITVDAGVKKMTINGDNAKVSINAGSVSNVSGNEYNLNLEGLAVGTSAMLTIKTGGDGSFVGQILSDEVKTHYLVVKVETSAGTASDGTNPDTAPASANPSTTPAIAGVPTGSVKFGGTSFRTYGSEAEAQAAVAGKENQFTISVYMVRNLLLTAEPSEGTARILASVCMVDGEDVSRPESRMNADSNWSATFDLSEYAGHQVTIVLKAEDGMAFNNGFSYVSFFVPQFEVEEEYIPPIVVTH